MKQIVKKAFLFSSLLALTSLSAPSAQAGFEWRPPQDNKGTVAPQVPQQSTTAPTQMMPIPVTPVETETAIEVPQRLITPTQPVIQQQPIVQVPIIQNPAIQNPVIQNPVVQTQTFTPSIAPQELTRPVAPPDAAPVPLTPMQISPAQTTFTQPVVQQPVVEQTVIEQPVVQAPVTQTPVDAKLFNDNVIVRPIERPALTATPPVTSAPVASPIITPVTPSVAVVAPAPEAEVKAEPKSEAKIAPQQKPEQKPAVKADIVPDVKPVVKQEVKTAPRVLPPVKHMNMSDADINRPFRVKRDPVPSMYFDEAPIVLGKTPRERKLSEVYNAPIVSSSNNVVIFDPDADVPMPRYSDVETPKEFARGFDNRGFDTRNYDDAFSPSSAHASTSAGAPQSILPSQIILEEPTQFSAAPIAVESIQPAPEPSVQPVAVSTLKHEDFQSPLPVVSRSVIAEPVEPIKQSTHDAVRDFAPRDFAPVAQTIQPQFEPVQVAAANAPRLMPVPTDGTVQGFGKRVPLVIAVRQIAPENYEFDFSQDVDMGALVDWEGGQSWNAVMEQTLAQYGLASSVNETTKIVSVYRAGYAPAVATTTPATPAMTPNWQPQVMPVSAPAVIEHQTPVHVSPNTIVPPPVETPRVRHVTSSSGLVSNTTDFGTTAPVQIQQNTQVIAPVQVAKELPQVAYKAPEAVQGHQMAGDDVWYGAKDSTLRSVLRDWSSKANVELYWDSQFDYPLQATVVVKGSFEEAVQRVLEGFEQAQPRPLGRLHKNSENGPSVLIVEANDLLD